MSRYYGKKTRDEIIDRIKAGEALESISSEKHMPSDVVISSWFYNLDGWRKQYEQAKQIQAELLAESALIVARSTLERAQNGLLEKDEIHAAKLFIDTARWSITYNRPQKYSVKAFEEALTSDKLDDAPKALNIYIHKPSDNAIEAEHEE